MSRVNEAKLLHSILGARQTGRDVIVKFDDQRQRLAISIGILQQIPRWKRGKVGGIVSRQHLVIKTLYIETHHKIQSSQMIDKLPLDIYHITNGYNGKIKGISFSGTRPQ